MLLDELGKIALLAVLSDNAKLVTFSSKSIVKLDDTFVSYRVKYAGFSDHLHLLSI